jgi:hypothetical protein
LRRAIAQLMIGASRKCAIVSNRTAGPNFRPSVSRRLVPG